MVKKQQQDTQPKLLILNQMAGPMTWELAEDLGEAFGCVAMLTGHPDTLAKGSTDSVRLYRSVAYRKASTIQRVARWIAYCIHAFFWLWKWPRTTPVLVFSNPPIGIYVTWLMRILRLYGVYVRLEN